MNYKKISPKALGIAASIAAIMFAGTALALTMNETFFDAANSIQGKVLGVSTSCPTNLDGNGDGIVNSMDMPFVLEHIGQNYPGADFNNDAIVNYADVSIMTSCWFAKR